MDNSLPSSNPSRLPRSLVASALAALALFGARFALRRELPERHALRLAVLLALGVAASWFVLEIVRRTRSLDEFERRIQGLALGFAFPVGLVATFALGLLASEGVITRVDPLDIPLVLVAAYLGGLAAAQRRFR